LRNRGPGITESTALPTVRNEKTSHDRHSVLQGAPS